MKIAFAGTPRFGALVLGALLRSSHEVVLVLTQPDRPAGRGRRERFSAVKELAVQEGLRVEQPEKASDREVLDLARSLGARALTIAAFGQILKSPLLGGIQCINVHASLLPKYRGAAPIERAIMDGEGVTGVSIMEVEPALDTGPVFLQRAVLIEKEDDAGSMYAKLGEAGGEALAEVLEAIEAGGMEPRRQDDRGATYAEKITPHDMRIDWSEQAWRCAARVRALSPHIGAFTEVPVRGQAQAAKGGKRGGEAGAGGASGSLRLKVWKAIVAEGGGEPGRVRTLDERLLVACGTGTLELLEVQPPGKRRMSAAEFLRGYGRLVNKRSLA
ncbi:MAG: methionyl-tRNA formyltransferase [Pseudomonadota bacterium]